MNTKLVESLAEIIKSLEPEEKVLLNQKLNQTNEQQTAKIEVPLKTQERLFYETATHEEWVKAFREWAESHPRNSPILSDEAVSRRGIYEKSES